MIKYNFPQLNQAADDCGSATKNLTAELDGLTSSLQGMLGTWDGAAREAYYQRQKEWDAAANDLRDLLGRIEKALRESAEKMQARENANKAKFGG
ncbi:WXG100 family type VII secretion target [Symbioplanes lichenis]|uniref:WXG100 family type VII secretion target n=1 Tax=Symbioplanes lichenis TaxID=1629072 RepID=UPI002739A33C|nr:WXG100 family type VII secretion target [Actinoplanes lichenis]